LLPGGEIITSLWESAMNKLGDVLQSRNYLNLCFSQLWLRTYFRNSSTDDCEVQDATGGNLLTLPLSKALFQTVSVMDGTSL